MKCFYHKPDHDGHCSGAIVKRKFPNCEMFPINHGDDFPWEKIEKNETVFMVDFCLEPKEDMIRLKNNCQLIWIDHHISAIKASQELGFNNIDGLRSVEFSGCELTWKYLYYGEITPEAVRLIGRYDIWDHNSDKRTIPFEYGLNLEETNPDSEIWSRLLDHDLKMVETIVEHGNIIFNYETITNKRIMKSTSYIINFEGYRALVANRGFCDSYLFDSIYDPEKHDILIKYSRYPECWRVSIITRKDEIDVSEIAKKYGGGGHRGASGFRLENIDILLPIE